MPAMHFFWFFSAAFWLIILHFGRVDPAPGVWSERPSDDEIRTFRRRLALAVCAPQLLLGVLDVLSGLPNPALLDPPDWANRYSVASWGAILALYLVLLWWLWARDGAAYLARFAPVVNLPMNPKGIRWSLTGMVVLGTLVAIVRVAFHV